MSEPVEKNERLSLGDYLREKDLTDSQKRFDRAKRKYERLVETFRIEQTESNWMKFEDGAKEFLDASERVYKSSSAHQQNWDLVTRDYQECLELKNNAVFDSPNVGRTTEETKPGKTKAGRKEEFIQWKGTHEELVLLLEILKDKGLIHYEQFPLTKICGLFVDKQFQNLKRGSVKRKNYVVKANREELKKKN